MLLKQSLNRFLLCISLPLLLIGYMFLVWPALTGPFIFDDFPNLNNLELLNKGLTWPILGQYLASFIDSPGRPISALSFLINDYGWPSDPFSFKYTNVLIHLLNGVLLLGMLRSLVKCSATLPQNIYWPFLVMAAWLLHPLQLSAQMLVVQRMTLLSATFCMAGLWAYIALLQHSKTLWSAFIAMASLGIATILAFLCKENGALLPLYALVLNCTLLQPLIASKQDGSRRLLNWGCFIPSLLLVFAIAYSAAQPYTFSSREFNMIERLLTQSHVLFDYLKQIIMPSISNSGIYFDNYPISRSLLNPISTLLYTLLITAFIVFAFVCRKRFAVLSFGILWFFSGHLMESTVLDLELYFEHRNYMPLIGLLMVICSLPFYMRTKQKVGFLLFFTWLGLLGTITALQAPVWGNQALIAKLWASEKPLSLRATQELARFHYNNKQPQQAYNTLTQAYDRGLNYADLPMSALLAKCWRPYIKVDRNLYQSTVTALFNAPYSNSVLESLRNLRQATQASTCENTISTEQWLALTDAMLHSDAFRINAESHIRVERANYFIYIRDLNNTMKELERAYAINPTVKLSQKIAEVLMSAGLTDEAAKWLGNGLKLKQPFFDTLMYDPKDYSRNLLKAIDSAKHKQADAIMNKTK